MDEAIRVSGLTKRFGPLEVLRGIRFVVRDSGVLCLIGPSGSGKSTLLRCLNGLEEASGGEVLVHGVSVYHPRTDLNALRTEIGMVFQRFNLFPHKTVLENITLAPSKLRGLTAAQARERTLALLEKVDVLDKRDGATWRKMAADDPRIVSGGYMCGVWVDPKNPDIVYTLQTSSYKSVDGGATFTGFKGAPGGDDPQVMWIDPTNSQRIFLGLDQGASIPAAVGRAARPASAT